MTIPILAIAAGGAIGSVLRFLVSSAAYQVWGRGFPYGTLSVNVLGALLMGFLSVLLIERFNLDAEWRAAVLIGLLGGFTTFSSFSIETLNLLTEGEAGKALLNVLLNVLLCVLATWCGLLLARQL